MKKELKNILVPVDFKAPSQKAIKYGADLALKLQGNLVLLNVLDTPGIIADFFSSGKELVKLTDRTKEKLLSEAEKVHASYPELKITTRIERGKPYQKILDTAAEINARMIILGENHEGTDINQELGSTVYHVTLRSPVPVLTLRGNTEAMSDKIVVPIDLTRQMRKQLFSALVYGLNYHAKIYLVSAVVGGIKMRESRIYKKLMKAKRTLEENGIECHTQLFKRSKVPPFRRVIQYADDIKAGMILLLTHEEGYTYDNYIGAFAHHIINESKIPVLSLTASATNVNFSNFLKGFVDPAGMFLKD
jgi:nucleotide-binding universal stress UspA family protein